MKRLRVYVAGASLLFLAIWPAHALLITYTFTDLNEQTHGGGPPGDYTTDFEITNGTGILWTDLHITDLEPTGSLQSGFYTGPGTAVASVVNSLAVIDILNISITDGMTLNFSVKESCVDAVDVCSLGGTRWSGYPTVNGSGNGSVPEPSTIALLALAAGMGLGVPKLRRKQ